jgi:hypothetical protein
MVTKNGENRLADQSFPHTVVNMSDTAKLYARKYIDFAAYGADVAPYDVSINPTVANQRRAPLLMNDMLQSQQQNMQPQAPVASPQVQGPNFSQAPVVQVPVKAPTHTWDNLPSLGPEHGRSISR